MFIAFEGIDGAGKTTLSTAVTARLRHQGADVELFHKKSVPDGAHPYVRHHIEGLSRLLWTDADTQPTHLLGEAHWVRLMSAYFAAVEEAFITPATEAGRMVVTDNWYYKFFSRMTVDTRYPRAGFERVFQDIGDPDLVVFLDVPPETAAARKTSFTLGEKGGHMRSDSACRGFVDYQTKVASFYRGLASELGWHWLTPGARSVEELAEEVVGLLRAAR